MAVVKCWYKIIDEVFIEEDKWRLCLQWGRYNFYDGKTELGFRFIWKDEKGHLRAQRGQACIKSLDIAQELINEARREGWGDNTGDYI